MKILQLIIDLPPDQYRVIEARPPALARWAAWLVATAAAQGPALVRGIVKAGLRIADRLAALVLAWLVATTAAPAARIDRARWPAWLTYRALVHLVGEAGRGLVGRIEAAGIWTADQLVKSSLRGVTA